MRRARVKRWSNSSTLASHGRESTYFPKWKACFSYLTPPSFMLFRIHSCRFYLKASSKDDNDEKYQPPKSRQVPPKIMSLFILIMGTKVIEEPLNDDEALYFVQRVLLPSSSSSPICQKCKTAYSAESHFKNLKCYQKNQWMTLFFIPIWRLERGAIIVKCGRCESILQGFSQQQHDIHSMQGIIDVCPRCGRHWLPGENFCPYDGTPRRKDDF